MPKFHLPDDGFIVLSLGLSTGLLQSALVDATQRPYAGIFKEVGGLYDPYRAQSRVDCRPAVLRAVRDRLLAHVHCLDERWVPRAFAYLRSLPGGDEQQPHQDYPSEDMARAMAAHPGSIPASAIISLTDGTCLRVFPRCFSQCSGPGIVVVLPAGHAIVFRGDLLHCGMAYTAVNYRLHCYLTLPDKDWDPDIVSSAAVRTHECSHCGRQDFLSSPAARQHRLKCPSNPKHIANMEKRRERERGEFPCPHCNHKPFRSQGGLRKHRLTHK
jgi:hypothetical protein